ncbi:hypothetical protein H0H92_001003 [Tricholoma furcatifolium]|nr:hypothetical protein H0H92_001003 [Tricholoma furcatifolium]
MEAVKPAEPGYMGRRAVDLTHKEWTILQLKEAGFEFMEWPDRPSVITDSSHRVIVALIGQPKSLEWDSVIKNAASLLNNFHENALKAGFLAGRAHRDNRQGNFYAVASGVSMGGGRVEPGVFAHELGFQQMLDELLAEKDIQRIANFQSNE